MTHTTNNPEAGDAQASPASLPTITAGPYLLPSGLLGTVLVRRTLLRLLPWAALPVAALLITAWLLADLRWALLALILLLVLYPMGVTTAWLGSALKPETIRSSTYPTVATIAPDGVTLTYLPRHDGDNPPQAQHLPSPDLNRTRLNATHLQLHCADTILLIPLTALPSPLPSHLLPRHIATD